VYGYNNSTLSNGNGVFGYGRIGVYGKPLSGTAGVGVQGESSTTAGSVGVQGFTSAAGTFAVRGSTGFTGSGTALYADASTGGTALTCVGTATFSGTVTFDSSSPASHAARITSTHTATAPLVIPSVSSFPAPVVGGIVAHSAFGICVSDGANWYGASALTLRG
jgi:hypothetical protein